MVVHWLEWSDRNLTLHDNTGRVTARESQIGGVMATPMGWQAYRKEGDEQIHVGSFKTQHQAMQALVKAVGGEILDPYA